MNAFLFVDALSEVRRMEEEAEKLINEALRNKEKTIENANKKANEIIEKATEEAKKIASEADAKIKKDIEAEKQRWGRDTEVEISKIKEVYEKNENVAIERALKFILERIKRWP